jgi:hypothetical protein
MDTYQNHRYRCHAFDSLGCVEPWVPTTVIFEQSDPSVPMPDPDFLRVHYQIAKILDVSGIQLKIDSAVYADREWMENNPNNIAGDGSTDLEHVLSRKLLMNI